MRKHCLTSIAIGLSLVLFVLMFLQIDRSSAATSTILISAVYYDTYLPNQPEESFRLANISAAPISRTNWLVIGGGAFGLGDKRGEPCRATGAIQR